MDPTPQLDVGTGMRPGQPGSPSMRSPRPAAPIPPAPPPPVPPAPPPDPPEPDPRQPATGPVSQAATSKPRSPTLIVVPFMHLQYPRRCSDGRENPEGTSRRRNCLN